MKKRVLHLYIITLVALFLSSCQSEAQSEKPIIYASIAPVKYIVESIVGSDFTVRVLVPSGASPESFEPTPRQYIALNEAKAVMCIGLIDFEKSLISRLEGVRRVVELSKGVEVIAGSCSHNHSHNHSHTDEHHHGVDPHIWTSPVELQRMALNCYEAIATIYPDSTHYQKNYEFLQQSLEQLDAKVADAISASGTKSFVIHHPAYTYFARDYSLEQVSIEYEGKDPSTRRIGQLIEQARAEGISKVLYQRQFPSSVVDVIASDIGAKAVAVDPLSEDIVTHIAEFTSLITDK
ncbi:MAG: zinc ABC transporter substrate-binding protein [Rikenellaceae bacterium]